MVFLLYSGGDYEQKKPIQSGRKINRMLQPRSLEENIQLSFAKNSPRKRQKQATVMGAHTETALVNEVGEGILSAVQETKEKET